MSKIVACQQCGGYHRAERSTKKFCSNACRQRHKRGVPYESVYAVWTNPQLQADVEYLALLAENDRSTFAALQRMKEKYGKNAMLAALHILQDAKR